MIVYSLCAFYAVVMQFLIQSSALHNNDKNTCSDFAVVAIYGLFTLVSIFTLVVFFTN